MSQPFHPFMSVRHPLVVQFLDQVLPGKRVMDFSLHFPMDSVVTMKAEIQLSEEDAETFQRLLGEYELQIRPLVESTWTWDPVLRQWVNDDPKEKEAKT